MRKEIGQGSTSYIFSKEDVNLLGPDGAILRGCQRTNADGSFSRPGVADPDTQWFTLKFSNWPLSSDKSRRERVDRIIADRKIPIDL